MLLIKFRLFELEVYICTTEEQLNKLKCIAEVLEKDPLIIWILKIKKNEEKKP